MRAICAICTHCNFRRLEKGIIPARYFTCSCPQIVGEPEFNFITGLYDPPNPARCLDLNHDGKCKFFKEFK